MMPKAKSLLELADRKFSGLTTEEKALCIAAQKSGRAYFDASGKCLDEWGQGRIGDLPDNPSEANLLEIKAELVAWILTDRKAHEFLTHKGLSIYGAKLTGELDASFAAFPWQFRLFRCHVPDGIVLQNAVFGLVRFSGAHTGPLSADGIKVKGDVFLHEGFTAEGQVRFLGADVGGNVECGKGTFKNKSGNTLNACNIKVKGDVFLHEGFTAEGQVRFLGADVGGTFDCSKGTFKNTGGDALSADRIKVKGSVFLHDGFIAVGKVRFLNADVGGTFDCGKGTFKSKDGQALSADGIKVKGSVFLNKGFTAKGAVRFPGAEVGGNFGLSPHGGDKPSVDGFLSLENASVNGKLIIRDTTWEDAGEISLLAVSAGVLWDSMNSWPGQGKVHLDGFTYASIARSSTKSAAERLQWLALQPADPFSPQPYEHLAKVLRESGHEVAAREISFAKNKIADRQYRKQTGVGCWGWLSNWIWRRFFRLVAGYGYYPSRTGIALVVLFVLGGFVFSVGAETMVAVNNNKVPIASGDRAGEGSSSPGWRIPLKPDDQGQTPRWMKVAPFKPPYSPEFYSYWKLYQFVRNQRMVCVSLTKAVNSGAEYVGSSKVLLVFKPWSYSLDTLLPVIEIGPKKMWMPFKNAGMPPWLSRWSVRWLPSGVVQWVSGRVSLLEFVQGYRAVHIISGWLLGVLLVASWTGVIKK